jgi:hypothetical protein
MVSSLLPLKSGGVQIFHSIGFGMSSSESESSESLSDGSGSGSGGGNLGKGSSTIEGSDSGSEPGSESGNDASGISSSLSFTTAGAGTSREVLMLWEEEGPGTASAGRTGVRGGSKVPCKEVFLGEVHG